MSSPQRENESAHLWSPEAEQEILAALVGFGNAEAFDEIVPPLTADHFWGMASRIIFAAVREMRMVGAEVNTITLSEFLKSLGKLEKVGGHARIVEITNTLAGPHWRSCVDVLDGKLRMRKLHGLCHDILKALPACEDATEFLESAEDQLGRIAERTMDGNKFPEAVRESLQFLEDRKDGKNPSMIKTGVEFFDFALGGGELGRMDVIAARPGMGKSVILEMLAESLLLQGVPVLIFQQDMTVKKMVMRMACRRAGVPLGYVMRGNPSAEELDDVARQIKIVSKWPVYIENQTRLTGADIASRTRVYKRKHGVQLVGIDHFQRLSFHGKDMRVGFTQNATDIKSVIHETGAWGVILAQLNRAADERDEPLPKDIKECDQLFSDCDTLQIYWSKEEEERGKPTPITSTIWKDREGQKHRKIVRDFDGRLMRFLSKEKNLQRDLHEGPETPAAPLPYKD